jgi:hypothetical protein
MVGDNGTSGLFHRFVDCKFLYTFIRKITGEGGPVLKHWMGSAHCLLSPFFFARIIGLLVKSRVPINCLEYVQLFSLADENKVLQKI